jgi:PKD repeat protein
VGFQNGNQVAPLRVTLRKILYLHNICIVPRGHFIALGSFHPQKYHKALDEFPHGPFVANSSFDNFDNVGPYTLHVEKLMQLTLIRLLVVALLCWLPTLASAATQSIHVEWGYTPSSESTVTGFKLYQEGAFVCQTEDPNAIAMDCDVTLTADTTNFTLTATFSDGTESPHSTLYAFSTTATTALQAVINATPLTGSTPLTVNFSAASSTGSISSFSWDFGDGSTATGGTTSHAYSIAGTYTAQLTITDTNGQTSIASTTVTATDSSTTPATPPTAVISSSTAMGAAPLTVNFNGSGSTAANNATIATYSWSFGDGSSATGASIAHSFVTVGTYHYNLDGHRQQRADQLDQHPSHGYIGQHRQQGPDRRHQRHPGERYVPLDRYL